MNSEPHQHEDGTWHVHASAGHTHTHEHWDSPGEYRLRELMRGVAGSCQSAVVTNDIFTREDGEFLTRHKALRMRGSERPLIPIPKHSDTHFTLQGVSMKTSYRASFGFFFGIAALNLAAHPGHSGGKPWYGYLPPSVLSSTVGGLVENSTPNSPISIQKSLSSKISIISEKRDK